MSWYVIQFVDNTHSLTTDRKNSTWWVELNQVKHQLFCICITWYLHTPNQLFPVGLFHYKPNYRFYNDRCAANKQYLQSLYSYLLLYEILASLIYQLYLKLKICVQYSRMWFCYLWSYQQTLCTLDVTTLGCRSRIGILSIFVSGQSSPLDENMYAKSFYKLLIVDIYRYQTENTQI